MPNTTLRGKGNSIQIEDANVRQHMCDTIKNFTEAGLSQRIEGFTRSNNICQTGNISFENMQWIYSRMQEAKLMYNQVKNQEEKDKYLTQYKISGGDVFYNWLSTNLKKLRDSAEKENEIKDGNPAKPEDAPTTVENVLITTSQMKSLIKESTSDTISKKYNLTQVENNIGFSEEEQKWYGWSHRAVYGFGIGHEVKKGDSKEKIKVGFKCKTLDDCKKVAKDFAESVS